MLLLGSHEFADSAGCYALHLSISSCTYPELIHVRDTYGFTRYPWMDKQLEGQHVCS